MAFHIAEEAVVQPPGIAQAIHAQVVRELLPVQPPEVHSGLFHRTQYAVEHGLHEPLVRRYPRNGLRFLWIHPHVLRHFGIPFFVCGHSIGRMQVEGDLQVAFLQMGQQPAIVGEEAFVPRPSRPSSLAGGGVVPVHVDDQYIQRDIIALEVVHQLAQVVVRVGPVARPPVAEGVAGRQRHLSGKEGEIFQCGFVVVPVAHEVPVLALLSVARLYPRPVGVVEQEVARIVNQRPSVLCQQPVGHFHFLPVAHIAIHAVQGAEGTS